MFICAPNLLNRLELLSITGKPASQKKLPNKNEWYFEAQISLWLLSYADSKIVSRTFLLQKAASSTLAEKAALPCGD
jgi:hypothetical protein